MQTASHIYEIILALLPAIALMWRGGVFGGGYNGKDMFAYYTNLSNLLVCVYFALRCIFRAVGIDFAQGLLFSARSPSGKLRSTSTSRKRMPWLSNTCIISACGPSNAACG